MYTIHVTNYLKENTYPEAGTKVYDAIIERWESEPKIVLDLTDVNALPSLFLNTSIGKIIEEYGSEAMKKKIGFAHISATQIQRIREYVEIIGTKVNIQ